MRRLRAIVLLVLVASLVLTGCSKAAEPADAPIKKPSNVANGPETLEPAPTAVIEDTPKWTELPKPIGDVFAGSLDKGKFQAFAAMTQTTVVVRLKSAPKEQDLFRALDAATAFVPTNYTIQLSVYAPGTDGKDRWSGYEWTPIAGTLVKKGSGDADQSWDAAITAITQGSTTGIDPAAMKKLGTGEQTPPVLQ